MGPGGFSPEAGALSLRVLFDFLKIFYNVYCRLNSRIRGVILSNFHMPGTKHSDVR